KNEILGYIKVSNGGEGKVIDYLLSLDEDGFTETNIGNYLYLLGLLPDSSLLSNPEKIRSRINFNLQSISLLSSFNKPLFDRIAELPLKKNSLQQNVVHFLKKENEVKSKEVLCRKIFKDYPS